MWFVYVQDHGISECSDTDELDTEVKSWLETHHPEAITVIEGEDITGIVLSAIEAEVYSKGG